MGFLRVSFQERQSISSGIFSFRGANLSTAPTHVRSFPEVLLGKGILKYAAVLQEKPMLKCDFNKVALYLWGAVLQKPFKTVLRRTNTSP